MTEEHTTHGYEPGHPWYYVLGGRVLRLKEIRESAEESERGGYLSEYIIKAAQLAEPKRSAALREWRESALSKLKADIRVYREVARALTAHRQANANEEPAYAEVHGDIALKRNHLWNDFANLAQIDRFLSVQPDLFDS